MANVVRPYGDTLDDGKLQLSFTLPLPEGPRGREAARQCVLGWGFRAGGPRITNKLAVELGYDVGFGRGAYANDVATFIVRRMVERARSG